MLTLSVFVLFPALYWINSELAWAKKLFVCRDRSRRTSFLVSVCVLHIAISFASILWLKAHGWTAAEVGIVFWKLVPAVLALAVAGLLIASFEPRARSKSSSDGSKRAGRVTMLIAPVTRRERFSWVAFCLVAGICEELIYRGIAISLLRSAGWNVTYAIGLSAISFATIHGRSILKAGALAQHLVFGVLLGIVYVWTQSLLTVITMHVAWNLLLLLRPVELPAVAQPFERSDVEC